MQALTNDLSKSFSLLSVYLAQLLLRGPSNFRMSDDVGHLLYRQASTPFCPFFIVLMSQLNNALPHPGLTGAFLFATTTARSSPALLGWNCGYALFSNVSRALTPPFLLRSDKKHAGHVRRALCYLS